MASTTYTALDGQTVDEIAWGAYGTLDGGIVEQIYAANPGLADQGPILAYGPTITLPTISGASTTQGVRLWD